MPQALIIDPVSPDFLKELEKLPLEVRYKPDAARQEILASLAAVEALILNSKIQVDREVIEAAPRLELLVRAGVGMDHIDEALLSARGVRVRNALGANADAVGELAVGLLLSLMRNIRRADAEVRRFEWKREANRGREIKGATVGIVGYGHTGRAVARKLSGFGARLLAYDKYRVGYKDGVAEPAALEEIFSEADILTLHVPLTAETRHLADASFFRKFRKPIYFLNLSRGQVAELGAVLEGLETGKLLGAALDVLEQEPPGKAEPALRKRYEALFARNDVILTPHIGGWTLESAKNIEQVVLAEIRAWLVGPG